jgi:hypothetical protein
MMKAVWLRCLFPFSRALKADGQKLFTHCFCLYHMSSTRRWVRVGPRYDPTVDSLAWTFLMVNVHIDVQAVIGNKVQRWIVLVHCQ